VSTRYVLNGRVRTSTLVLGALFLGLLALYIVVRPDPTLPSRRPGAVVQPEAPSSPRPSPPPPSPTAGPSAAASPAGSPSAVATPAVSPAVPALPTPTATP
jgi:hypothetical protein